MQRRIDDWRYDWSCRQVKELQPLEVRPGGLKIVSMVSGKDIVRYLVAIYSFYRKVQFGEIVVLNDGSLLTEHIALIRSKLFASISDMTDVEIGDCPRGGCWERLMLIGRLAQDHYVVQIDSDCLTIKEIPEVIHSVRENLGFALGTATGQHVVTASEASAFAAAVRSDHVQIRAERALSSLDDAHELRYARASAGFAGFPRGGIDNAAISKWSRLLEEKIGDTWHEWGSEQVMSNLIISNSPNAKVLPYPKYACFNPHICVKDTSFLHFLGSYRYRNDIYLSYSHRALCALRKGL
jgi:hypothetical protein